MGTVRIKCSDLTPLQIEMLIIAGMPSEFFKNTEHIFTINYEYNTVTVSNISKKLACYDYSDKPMD